MDESLEVRVKSTLLSRRPRDFSGLIAVLSVLLILLTSQLAWRDPDPSRKLWKLKMA